MLLICWCLCTETDVYYVCFWRYWTVLFLKEKGKPAKKVVEDDDDDDIVPSKPASKKAGFQFLMEDDDVSTRTY